MNKLLKCAGYLLAAALIVPILIFFGYPLVVAFSGYAFPAPVHQDVSNIASIEILDTSLQREDVIDTLDDSEIQPFMDILLEMKSARYVNDPADRLGDFTVKITYSDGSTDFIGTEICAYYSPDGRDESRGWYYVENEKLLDLINDYIDPADFA